MFAFAFVWPWIGLGAAGLLLILLTTNALRGDRAVSRWRDMTWLTWAATCAYLVHQLEEHGIDAQGATYAFRGSLCAQLGFANPQTCPVPYSFITAVNVSAVWVAGPVSALLAARWPVIGLSFFAVPFVNLFAHLGPAIMTTSYNPGLLSAVALFLPLSVLAFAAAMTRYHLGFRAVLATIVAGVILHAVLIGSLLGYLRGNIGLDLLIAIQLANPVLSALIVVLGAGRRSVRRFAT
jgi:hypothetical protein